MVAELQFAAIALFLLWCLASSVCGVLKADPSEARLVWREHAPAGWRRWREVYFGLTAADRRILDQPEPVLDRAACDGLLDTVLLQSRDPVSDAVQFAIVRMGDDRTENRAGVVYVSDVHAISAAWSPDDSDSETVAPVVVGHRVGESFRRSVA
jgi:hypothetical protein